MGSNPTIPTILESERKVRAGLSHFNGVKTGGKRKLAVKQVGLKRESAEPSVLETRSSCQADGENPGRRGI